MGKTGNKQRGQNGKQGENGQQGNKGNKGNKAGADPGFSEREGCTDVGDLEGAVRPLPTRGVWGHAPPEKFEI